MPIGGMTMDCDSVEDEPLAPLEDEEEDADASTNVGFVAYHGPSSIIDSDCADILDDADLRQYWEMQQLLQENAVAPPPDAEFARQKSRNRRKPARIACAQDCECGGESEHIVIEKDLGAWAT